MKKLLCLSALVICAGGLVYGSEGGAPAAVVPEQPAVEGKVVWLTSLELAQAEAAKRKVPILVDFTESDWCGWCIKLDKEVFDTPVFAKYASENLVLLQIDFPRKKTQSAELKKQNEALLDKFGVRGFPTIILLDASGQLIEKTSYKAGGAESYVKHLSGLLKNKK
jgi:protein disulfide-isomerase